MENQKLNDQLEAFRKLNKENYNNIRKQIFELKQAVDKNFNRSGSEGEAVKEKEYTILSFIGVDGRIRSLNESGNYRAKDFGLSYTLDSMLKGHDTLEDGSQQIHSVRRESDGEIFTLGDMVYLPSNSECAKKIQSIEIREYFISKMAVVVEDIIEWGLIHLQKAPIRKPILITEDGVEIFDGNEVFFVYNEPQELMKAFVIYNCNYDLIIKRSMDNEKGFLMFSTKEHAEEYIKLNKPMYSLNDVKSALFDPVNENHVLDVLEKLDRK